jgi:hypothetical protein
MNEDARRLALDLLIRLCEAYFGSGSSL